MAIMPSRREDIQLEMRARSMAFRYPELLYANPFKKEDPNSLYQKLTSEQKLCIDNDCKTMCLTKVGRNQFELVQPAIAQEAWDRGIAALGSYLNAGTIKQTANVLVNIMTTGLLSSQERYRQGILGLGCAPAYNIQTGSGNQVFTRMIPKSLFENNYPLSNFAVRGPIFLMYDVRALERMPYSYKKDRGGLRNPNYNQLLFGVPSQPLELFYRGVEKIQERQGLSEYIKEIKEHPHPTAETMFDETLSAKYIQKIIVTDETDKYILTDTLERARIHDINGIPLKEAIICSKKLNPSMLKNFNSEQLVISEETNELQYI